MIEIVVYILVAVSLMLFIRYSRRAKMRKIAALILAIILVFLFIRCFVTKDLSYVKPYSELIGKRFALSADTYIVSDSGEDLLISSIDNDMIDDWKRFKRLNIVFTLPEGTIFKVREIVKQMYAEGYTTRYYVALEGEHKNKWKDLNAIFLTKPGSINGREVWKFVVDYVKPLDQLPKNLLYKRNFNKPGPFPFESFLL